MKKVLALTLLSSAMLASGLASAQTAEIKVTGKIVPDACQPTIAGAFDYGTFTSEKLNIDEVTKLEAKKATLNVTCNAAAKVAVKVTDNRSGTAAGGADAGFDFGLGGKNTGSYTVALSNAVSNGKTLAVLTDTSGSGAWTSDGTGFKADGTFRKAFAAAGSTTPEAYKLLTGDLIVTPTINKLSELDLGNGVTLDGSATLELVYL